MTPMLLFELFSLVLAVGAEPLLVVGDVTSTSARILVDWGQRADAEPVWVHHGISAWDPLVLAHAPPTATIPMVDAPQIFVARGLESGSNYTVVFGRDMLHAVTFSTVNPASVHWRAVAFSCDRFLEDNDSEFVEQIGRDVGERYDLMVHMGDQVTNALLITSSHP